LSAAKVNRTNLIKSCILQKMPSEQIDSIQVRWMAGELDSVSLTTASCGGAWIECTPSIRYRVARSTFKSAPGLLDEVDVPSEFADVGRRTLNLSDVRDRKVDSYIGLRAKIPGNRFVKVITHEGAFLRGFKDIPVPKNFGIEVAEFYMGKFFIVYPYYSKAFKFGDYSFEPHPWITPSQYLPPVWAEGVMVFDGETEFRVKRTYTAEILIDGIAWEMFAGLDGTGSVSLQKLRPRPGKESAVMTEAAFLKHCYLSIREKHFVLIARGSRSAIRQESGGPYKGRTYTRQGMVTVIDSGIRMCLLAKCPVLCTEVRHPEVPDCDVRLVSVVSLRIIFHMLLMELSIIMHQSRFEGFFLP